MKKLILIILAILIVVVGGYGWFNRYDYFFKGDMEIKTENGIGNQDGEKEEGFIESLFSDDEEDKDKEIINTDATITDYDCSKSCENRKDSSSYEYCKEICGLNEPASEEEKKPVGDCNSLEGFEKDVCNKRKAVEEKKYDACNDITDSKLKENCENRVTEEIL